MFTLQRFMQMEALEERGIHEFDAWAATFGETRTELELQPSGLYKPVTRFSNSSMSPTSWQCTARCRRRPQIGSSQLSPAAHDFSAASARS